MKFFAWNKKAWMRALLCVIVIVIAAMTLANCLAWSNFRIVTQFLGQSMDKVIDTDGSAADAVYYESDFDSMSELQKAETEFAELVQSEGSVLLKNGGLPLAEGASVTLLGSGSADSAFLVSGGGSGAIDTSKKPSLEEVFSIAGFNVNPVMLEFYEGAGKSTRGNGSNYVGEAPQSVYTDRELSSYPQYGDAGIVFIGRSGQEGSDVATDTAEDPSKHMLELSDNELALIDSAISNFDKVVVILNTMNPMELGSLESRNVSVLWVGAGGQQGLRAIPKILNGTYNPSGKLVDTYAYDNLSAPAMANFGSFLFSNIEDTNRRYYYNYAENIYVGYKYYETRYADVVTGRAKTGEFDYSEEVLYPFGYGLSYTTFEYSDFRLREKDDAFEAEVTVTNTGKTDGKEAVEIYMQSPYTTYDEQNGIEKSAIELVGVTKTGVIEAGDSETVTVSVPKEMMRTYDAKTAKTYIVEAGTYYFAAGSNAHDALNNILAARGYDESDGMTDSGNAALSGNYTVDTTDDTTYSYGADGKKITNKFDDAPYTYFDGSFRYLTRSDWTGTWPQPLGTGDGESKSIEANAKIIAALEPPEAEADPDAVMPVTGADNGLTLASLVGADYDSKYWDMLLDQMKPDEMMRLVTNGGFGTILIPSISKPVTVEKDGPAGVSSTLIGGAGCFGYPIALVFASTWNIELERRLGYYFGNDALLANVPGIYAPSINMHRTPFSGRNFEYFSEDSFQSGTFAAALLTELQKKGVYCYTKHFALNDQERNRETASTFATEQAIREIYLRPFEIAVRQGGSRGIMTAKNRIGCVWSGGHKRLLTDVLRGEWGFTGHVITDACNTYNEDFNAKTSIDAGLDLYLTSLVGSFDIPGYASDASVMCDLRQACHRILYNIANSLAMNGISATSRVVFAMPPWGILLIIIDILLVLGAAVGSFFMVRSIIAAERSDKEVKKK